MSSYVFPGYPAFLESAAAELGHPESAGPAGRIVPLTALANLCAQASHGDPAHVRGILAKAAEFRDQLAVALRAAELMLADVEAGSRPLDARGSSRSRDAGDSRSLSRTSTGPQRHPGPRENHHDRLRDGRGHRPPGLGRLLGPLPQGPGARRGLRRRLRRLRPLDLDVGLGRLRRLRPDARAAGPPDQADGGLRPERRAVRDPGRRDRGDHAPPQGPGGRGGPASFSPGGPDRRRVRRQDARAPDPRWPATTSTADSASTTASPAAGRSTSTIPISFARPSC